MIMPLIIVAFGLGSIRSSTYLPFALDASPVFLGGLYRCEHLMAWMSAQSEPARGKYLNIEDYVKSLCIAQRLRVSK
jgi:hypothetical protein